MNKEHFIYLLDQHLACTCIPFFKDRSLVDVDCHRCNVEDAVLDVLTEVRNFTVEDCIEVAKGSLYLSQDDQPMLGTKGLQELKIK